MHWGEFFKWFVLTIVLPPGVPLAILAILHRCTGKDDERRKNIHPLRSINNGELAWIAIVLCFSGLGEMRFTAQTDFWFACAFGLIILVSGVLFVWAAAKPAEFDESDKFKSGALQGTFWTTLAAAAICVIVHISDMMAEKCL